MSKGIESKSLNQLFEGMLTLTTVEECYAFFEDLCCIPELKAMGQRFEVAKLLNEDVTYHSISAITKASTATISRVCRSLEYGTGGYLCVLKKLQEKNDASKK